jgi:hypothetical protein
MAGNPDTSLTIDIHHHILPDFFWQETENAHAPVGGLAPLRWSKEATISSATAVMEADLSPKRYGASHVIEFQTTSSLGCDHRCR